MINNFIAFSVQVFIFIISIFILGRNSGLLVLLIPVYIIVGFFLENQGSKWKNFLSVSSISFVLIFIWFFVLVSVIRSSSPNIEGLYTDFGPSWSGMYDPFNQPIVFIYDRFFYYSYYFFPFDRIMLSFTPSILIWLGLEYKSNRKIHINKVGQNHIT